VYLFDAVNGSLLREYGLGVSDAAIDPDTRTCYFADSVGWIQACGLDGQLEHICPVRFTQDFIHVLIWRHRDEYLVFSRSLGWPVTTMPEVWAAERVQLGDPARVDKDRILEETRSAGRLLQRKNKLLPPPTDGRWFWLATHNRLYALTKDLKVVRSLDGEFDPLAISLDESGGIYLLVADGEGAALWILTPEGERLLKVALPDTVSPPAAPPLIDHHHRSVVIGETGLVVVASDGTVAWQRNFEGFGGHPLQACITDDDQLLVSAGSQILAFDPKGQPTVLYEDNAETFLTAPVLDENGRLFVGSQSAVYCLMPGPVTR
jgi:sugar lactone lactonase YvrE